MADQRFWTLPENERIFQLMTDRGDGTHAIRMEAYPPKLLMTDGDGEYARLRVDVGQTGFFAGREFRTFYEFSIASGASRIIKVTAPIDTILQTFGAELDLAELRIELRYGGTEGGAFATSLPAFKTNSMSTASSYASQVIMAIGGTHTGGTVVDLLTLYSGANQNKAVASSASENSPQGFPAGTYYIHLINTDGATATGIFRARWEERP